MSNLKPHYFEFGEYILCTLNKDWNPSRPSDCHIQEWEGTYNTNHLNVDCPPNNPASFWIDRGYQVYSMLSEGHWLQIVEHPTKDLAEMIKHEKEYKKTFKFYEYSVEDKKGMSGCISSGVFDDCHCAYCS